jgi:hypothetical protein
MENTKTKVKLKENNNSKVYDAEIVSKPDILSKSNLLITSKYKFTLDCQKIMYITLLMYQGKNFVMNEYNQPEIRISTAKLRELLNTNSTSIYARLDDIAQQLTNTPFGFTNPQNETFDYLTIVNRATYKNGELIIVLNPALSEIENTLRKTGFTQLERQIMMSWKSVYSYRLYELTRQRAYYPANYTGPRSGLFEATFDLYELRLLLGIVNSNLRVVQEVLRSTNPPDYKKACEASPEKLYLNWGDFKKRVLTVAVNEINESPLSDIKIDYELKKKAHGEIYAIRFIIKTKEYKEQQKEKDAEFPTISTSVKNNEIKIEISESDKFYFLSKVLSIFEEYNIGYENAVAIAEAAQYDIEEIKRVAKDLKQSHTNIDNIVGWIITDIKSPYQNNISKKAKNDFNDFEQRKYDMDEIERVIMQESYLKK